MKKIKGLTVREAKIELDLLLNLPEVKGNKIKESDVVDMYADKGFGSTFERIIEHTSDGSDDRIYVKFNEQAKSLVSKNEQAKTKGIFSYLLKEFDDNNDRMDIIDEISKHGYKAAGNLANVKHYNKLAMDPETDYTVEIDDVIDHDLLDALVDLNADYTVEISDLEITPKDESAINKEEAKYPNINEVCWGDFFDDGPDYQKIELDEGRLNNIIAGIDEKGINETLKEYTSNISPYEVELNMDDFLDGVEIKKETEFDFRYVPIVNSESPSIKLDEDNVEYYVQLEDEIEAEPVDAFGKYKSKVTSLEDLALAETHKIENEDVVDSVDIEPRYNDYEIDEKTGLRILPNEYLKEKKSNVVSINKPVKKKTVGGWMKGVAAAALIVGAGLMGYGTNNLKPIEIKPVNQANNVEMVQSYTPSINYDVSEVVASTQNIEEIVENVPLVVKSDRKMSTLKKINKSAKKLKDKISGKYSRIKKTSYDTKSKGHEIPESIKISYDFDMPARGTVNLGEPIHSKLPSLNNLYSSKVNAKEPSVKYEWNGGQPEFSNLTQEQRCRMISYGFGEKERSPSGLIKTMANIGRKHIAKYCSNFGKPAPKPENAQEPSVVYNWDGPAKKKVFSHFFQEAGRMDMLK